MPTDAQYEALLVGLGEAIADIKARLEVIEGTIVAAGLISHEQLVKATEAKFAACNLPKIKMDEEFGPAEETDKV